MITGSPAVTVRLWIRASGVSPCSFSAASDDDQHRRGAVADLAGRGGADHAALLEQLDRADRLRAWRRSGCPRRPRALVLPSAASSRPARSRPRTPPPRSPPWRAGGCERDSRRAASRDSHISSAIISAPMNWLKKPATPIFGDAGGRLKPLAGTIERPIGARRHALDAGRDHHVLRARHHRLRGELDRLLRGAALPVDRHRRHALRQLRGEHRVARRHGGLLARLGDAAHDHVVDRRGIDARRARPLRGCRGEIDRMHAGQPARPCGPRRCGRRRRYRLRS